MEIIIKKNNADTISNPVFVFSKSVSFCFPNSNNGKRMIIIFNGRTITISPKVTAESRRCFLFVFFVRHTDR